MTNEIPNPLPETATIIGDDGLPTAVVNIDKMQMDAITLAYDMAQHCGDHDALDAVSVKWLNKLGPDAFGYAAAGALRTLAAHVLDPTLQVLEEVAPSIPLRAKLAESYRYAAGQDGDQ